MHNRKTPLLIAFIGLALTAIPILPFKGNNIYKDVRAHDGGVLISNGPKEDGPMFYPAEYSTDISDEPYYSTQNGYTFSSMNYVNTSKKYRGDSVKVAVIDSGLNYDHEDFKLNENRIIKSKSRSVEYSSGWKYYEFSNNEAHLADGHGHGTNVASVIASQINALGCAGIAPNVELYVYKVTNANYGYEWVAIQNCLNYCKEEGIDVINMSFQAYENAVSYGGQSMAASAGCSSQLTSWLNECHNAGITLVAAAGNFNTAERSYPASNDYVISVGSLEEGSTTTKAGYSNLSDIDLVAPGTVYVADKGTTSAYKKTQGTSFSAPIVTAAIALYKQKNPSATPDQIESALYASCDSISGNPSWAGNGRLNIDKFLGVDYEDQPTDIVINNPEIVDDELELQVGDYLDLDWTVNGVGTFDDSVNFYTLSGKDNVVSVNQNGRITAVSEGNEYVVIESNVDSSVYASVYVTVTSSGAVPTVSSVTVSPSSLSLDLNGTKTGNLTATVNGDNNPSQEVTWSSSNTTVATVSSSGVVTAKAVGNATITATSQADNTKSGTCTVTVSDSTVHVTGVSLNKNSTSLTVGGSETLTATVSPNNATNQNVTWSSSNTTVATVSNGTISAKATGSSTITVTTVDGSYTATCTVTVNAPNTQTLTITRSSFANSGGYAWYTWTQATSDSVSITGKAELYTTETGFMQFNKSKGNKIAAIYNTTAIPGTITKIEATTDSTGTNRTWNAYVTSTACSGSGSTLTFGSNKTTVGSNITITKSSTSLGTSNAGYSYFCLQEVDSSASYLSEIKITYIPKSISSIEVKTSPSKTTYDAGENFDPTGLVITVNYSDSTTTDVDYATYSSSFSFSPNLETALTTQNTNVQVTYSNKTCNIPITVKSLSSITISGNTTSYVEGDTFVKGTVTAHYSDSTTADVTNEATFTGYDMTDVSNQTVTVSYGGKSLTYGITVSQGTLSSIAVSGQTTVYNKGNPFSFDGTCTATFANGYQKSVTPTSISSPNMNVAGVKTITVSYIYNGNTRTTSYDITVNSNRTVIETTTTTGYSVVGTVTWPSNTQTVSANSISISTSGYTAIESNAIRLGSGSNTGTVTISSTSSNITKVVVSAKTYGSDTGVTLTVGGTSNTITSSYADYVKEYVTATNSVSIATTTNKKRAYIESITIYETKETTIETDISTSEDCVGLETFISTYMHMDYTENLGYCNDNEHHYYSTAKTAFNALNNHQRNLFTSNSAYLVEWTRLSTWASKNGDSLNQNNKLAVGIINPVLSIISDNSFDLIITLITISIASISICGYFILHKKRKIR